VIDSQKTTFQIGAEYQPFPGMDPASVVVTTFNGEACHDIDARAKSDVVLKFRDCPPTVTGTVVIGRFATEPAGQPGLQATPDQGGLGIRGVKWVGIGVAGFSQGTGIVDLYYHGDEIKGLSPTDFVLGALFHQKWEKLLNLGLFNGDQYVQGEMPVSTLNGNPIIALASGEAAAQPTAVPTEVAGTSLGFLRQVDPLVAAGGAGAALLLVAAYLLLRTPRQPKPISKPPPGPALGGPARGGGYTTNQLAGRGSPTRPLGLPDGSPRDDQNRENRPPKH
jgi:hypothetical protein